MYKDDANMRYHSARVKVLLLKKMAPLFILSQDDTMITFFFYHLYLGARQLICQHTFNEEMFVQVLSSIYHYQMVLEMFHIMCGRTMHT